MHDRLRLCRLKLDYSQKYVAMTIGVSKPTISQWENGVKRPTIENLISLAALYKTSIDYLVGLTDEHGVREDPDALSIDERQLILTYRSLNSQGREYIRQQLDIASRLYSGKHAVLPNVENE